MLAFGIAQIIVTNLQLVDCGKESDSSFSFLCSTGKGAYYVPMAILLFINLCGGVFGIVCRHLIDNDQKGNYY
ncbi:hypothetical protein DICPUDRAFT_91384 [Dictyostelium purpureum]|uniref:Uncharacterized protein n=1 Tax=Dictyostelium purpureum TaxID=5786 RepID=F0ZBJ0_DICPU|nr:uncharacterized protein DICPUDRAFT_91384 [Dictyostelium purpureum]EGC38674.1 hypothetical protein DICPUDRAFT_91384 [Dictyostelium purpureum]|eukprot:XP_003284770.1 hypothetical protein DICPUDRAFT_91384 [Dictyostelium purpureum]